MRKLVVLSTLVVCLSAASTASAAAAPPEFYGVVGGKYDPTASDFARMGKGRVGSVRVNFAWASVQSSPGAPYDWGRYDSLVANAAENNVRILATFYGTPSFAAARPNFPPTPAHLGEFAAFMRAAVERYGTNGTFWSDPLNLLNPKPTLPIVDWQLFNEVNSPSFWSAKPKAKQYRPFLVAAHDAIKGADPNARLILAGLFTDPHIKNGVTLQKYLTDLYRMNTKGLFDAVAVHPYAITPAKVLQAVGEARNLMSRFKDKSKPIWLTEIGWATAGQKTPLTVKPGVQAKYLRQTYGMAAAKRNKLKIAGVYWYTFKDLPSRIWIDNTGLFTTGGAPKPSWNAFVGLTGGTP